MSSKPAQPPLMERLVSLCKRRGFIFQSSEIYGGINGFWDYGPLGTELKRNVKEIWWKSMTRLRDDIAGLDATIIMHPQVWRASGHVETFSDPMIDCKTCKGRFRADQIDEIPCPQKPSKMVCACEGEKTEPRAFNLMFETNVGPVKDAAAVAYLRPETAQAIFAQFKNVLDTARKKVPFGIAQIGKAFRNEVTPRNFTFRSREFEQMELEYFIRPDEAVAAIAGTIESPSEEGHPGEPGPNWGWQMWHKYWLEERVRFYEGIGLDRSTLEEYWQKPEELAHYARATVDLLFKFPFGTQELEGVAARSDFDLSQHARHSGKPMYVFDDELRDAWAKLDPARQAELRASYQQARLNYLTRSGVETTKAQEMASNDADGLGKGQYIPHVIEPSAGVDRLVLALLCNGYDEEEVIDDKGKAEIRTVLRLHPRVAPIKVAVFPLLRNKPDLVAKAREIHETLRPLMAVDFDDGGAIGKRYRKQDEIGTPFGVTVDFDTLGENDPALKETVTLRHRDSMKQERIPISELPKRLLDAIG